MKYRKINVTINTAERFNNFKRKLNGNNSQILDKMITFFEYNDIDLNDPDNEVLSVGKLVNKRFNAIYGMLKIIEKEQTKPTKGMLAQMFAQLNVAPEKNVEEETLIEPVKKPRFVEKNPTN